MICTDADLNAFRPRIINWARAYRDRSQRGQSPLAIVLHEMKVQAGQVESETPEQIIKAIDQADADFLDQCALRIDRDSLKILRIAYLDRFTTLDYETAEDQKRSEHIKALRAGVKSSKAWRMFLKQAETDLYVKVDTLEKLRYT